MRNRLLDAGFEPMAPAAIANPSIVTFAPLLDRPRNHQWLTTFEVVVLLR